MQFLRPQFINASDWITVVIERVVDLMMLVVSFIVVAFLEYDVLHDFAVKAFHLDSQTLQERIQTLFHTWWFYLILISPIMLLIFLRLYFRWHQKKKSATFEKITNLFLGIVKGLKTVMKMENNWVFIFHTVFIWTMYFIVTYACFFSIPATSGLDVKAGIFTLAIGGVGMTAPVQGGFGAYHLIVSQGLTLFGIPLSDGLVLATIIHTSQTLLVMLCGAISVLYFLKPNKSLI